MVCLKCRQVMLISCDNIQNHVNHNKGQNSSLFLDHAVLQCINKTLNVMQQKTLLSIKLKLPNLFQHKDWQVEHQIHHSKLYNLLATENNCLHNINTLTVKDKKKSDKGPREENTLFSSCQTACLRQACCSSISLHHL